MPHRQVFRFDPEGVVEAMRLGEPAECIESKFGYNDHVINWFSEKGFWRIWESMRADVKRANGIPQECLNGVFAALTLSRIGSIQKADPMLEDGRLMTELGFNIITVQKRLKDGKGVIHRDTLRNHVKRIPVAESKRAFYEHVSLMRSRKWLRGGVYAADGMKIEVTSGKSYEGCGRVWDPERKQFVFGYKVVYVFNLSPERPRIIAIAIGPINADERTLLVEALQDLRAHVCNPRDIIDILVLDRGYWGVEHLSRLKGEFGLDIVTICKAGLTIHDEAQRLVALDQGKRPLIRHRRRVNNQGHESRYIRRIRAVEGLEALDKAGTVSMRLNAVCVSEVDEDSGEASDTIFLTTLDVSANSAKVVDYYDQRWSIENRCNRELSQNWNVRRPIGRRLTAIFAQLCMASMCLNAVRIYREHKPKDAEKLESEMRTQGHKSYMLGRGAVVIVPGRQIYATMRYVRYLNLLALKAARRSAELVSQGIPMEQVLEIVSQEMKE